MRAIDACTGTSELSVVIPTLETDPHSVEAVLHLIDQEFDEWELILRNNSGASLARNAGVDES